MAISKMNELCLSEAEDQFSYWNQPPKTVFIWNEDEISGEKYLLKRRRLPGTQGKIVDPKRLLAELQNSYMNMLRDIPQ